MEFCTISWSTINIGLTWTYDYDAVASSLHRHGLTVLSLRKIGYSAQRPDDDDQSDYLMRTSRRNTHKLHIKGPQSNFSDVGLPSVVHPRIHVRHSSMYSKSAFLVLAATSASVCGARIDPRQRTSFFAANTFTHNFYSVEDILGNMTSVVGDVTAVGGSVIGDITSEANQVFQTLESEFCG